MSRMSATSSTIDPRTPWDHIDNAPMELLEHVSQQYGAGGKHKNVHVLHVVQRLLVQCVITAHGLPKFDDFLGNFEDELHKIMCILWPRPQYGLVELRDHFKHDIICDIGEHVNPTPQSRPHKNCSSAESSDSSAPTVGYLELCVFLMVMFFLLS